MFPWKKQKRAKDATAEMLITDCIDELVLRLDSSLHFETFVTKSFRNIFGSMEKSKLSFYDLIIANSNFSPAIKMAVKNRLRECFGTNEETFESLRGKLPTLFHLIIDGHTIKIAAQYRPLLSKGKVNEVLFVGKPLAPDETGYYDHRAYDHIYRVFKLVKERHQDFMNFVMSSKDFIKDSIQTLRSIDVLSEEDIEKVFGNLNLIKVSAKFIGFEHITMIINNIERLLGNVRFEISRTFFCEEMIKHLELLLEVINSYVKISSLVEGTITSEKVAIKNDFKALLAARSFFRISRLHYQENISEDFSRVSDFFEDLYSVPLESVLSEIADDFAIMAKRHGKKNPQVHSVKSNINVAKELVESLKKIFVSAVLFSLEYSDLKKLGEDDQLQITFEGEREEGRVVIDYYDNGLGFDSSILGSTFKKDLASLDLATREGILTSFFIETKPMRGGDRPAPVGQGELRALRSLLEASKGSLSLHWMAEEDGFWKFKIRMMIPQVRHLMLQNRNLMEDISVVIIDNDIKTVHALKQHFLDLGVRTKIFANETSGFKYVTEHGADLLISDYLGNALDTVAFLKKLKATKSMPFLYILVTENHIEVDKQVLMSYVSAIFRKPIDARAITDYVEDAIYKKKTA